jgi:RNA polymerase sigma-70 factor (ECF subfamily)
MDRYLVERARSGDQEAFAGLVHQVSDSLFGITRRILRDPGLAEDVLQNALVTIWRRGDLQDSGGPMAGQEVG